MIVFGLANPEDCRRHNLKKTMQKKSEEITNWAWISCFKIKTNSTKIFPESYLLDMILKPLNSKTLLSVLYCNAPLSFSSGSFQPNGTPDIYCIFFCNDRSEWLHFSFADLLSYQWYFWSISETFTTFLVQTSAPVRLSDIIICLNYAKLSHVAEYIRIIRVLLEF